ncbi:MAG: acetoacetate--CoA ligase [Myxococcales bacterium]|nr:acetoacetate--CoA ligase [Myxococcales bacterium]
MWTPSADRAEASQLAGFLAQARQRSGRALVDYDALHRWSVEDLEAFWGTVWDYVGVVASVPYRSVLCDGDASDPRDARWFEGARLNFAENLLRHAQGAGDSTALVAVTEGRVGVAEATPLTYRELLRRVGAFQQFLRARGVGVGDRVAGFLPNRVEAVVAMLATTGLGAIWSSCSPDFGFSGVMDRFGQIGPTVLVACDGYRYGGRRFETVDRVRAVAEAVESLRAVVVVDVLGDVEGGVAGAVSWQEALSSEGEAHFEQLPPDHPVYILYSSGTTGVPKCIVHGAAGTLVQHAKELVLHSDVRASDALFYFTTCGWMMWNWLVSGLFTGCRVVLFDGSPGHPDLGVLWRMAAEQGVTHFGTSPKFLASVQKQQIVPKQQVDLELLRVVMSTGSPLSPAQFRWVYDNVKSDLQLASIAGGTDIVSCFMLGSPIDPVYAGEIQKRGLGMAVEAWTEEGVPVVGEKAELVCTRPFPSMPVGFYNDPDGARYKAAYFEHFPGVWRHGDFVEITEHGGVVVYGRSDATLNPGGVRIGTAEIYRVVEGHPAVQDSLVVGLPVGNDVRIVLFVVGTWSDALEGELRTLIRTHCTPRHVPWKVIQCPAVPRTISGKKVEIAVTRLLRGDAASNRDALANPEALDYFAGLAGTL